MKGVTDSIAHDLRTPLTRVRGQLYRFCQTPGPHADGIVMVEAAISDLDLVLDRFAALLRISELEVRGRRAGFAIIQPDHLLKNLHDLYEPLAEERAITLTIRTEPSGPVQGDEKLLFEALSNLIDNAIKFTPVGSRVTLSLTQGKGGPVIAVADSGPGISAGERDAVLQRFYRGVDAGGVPGSGLGLSVVSAIVHLHGFALELENAEPGLVARICCTSAESVAAVK